MVLVLTLLQSENRFGWLKIMKKEARKILIQMKILLSLMGGGCRLRMILKTLKGI